jgi:small subunit ribosomal protein S2
MKQCKDSIARNADRCGMPSVANRWLGGLLTNWGTVNKRVQRLHELRTQKEGDQLKLLPTRERLSAVAELEKLETNLGGVSAMERLPDAVVVVDLNNEAIAVRECNRLGIPIIGLVDTNCDPDEATYIIPGNDDAIRSCDLVLGALADGVIEGRIGEQAAEAERLAEAAAVEAEAAAAGAAVAAAEAEIVAEVVAEAEAEVVEAEAELVEAVAEAEAEVAAAAEVEAEAEEVVETVAEAGKELAGAEVEAEAVEPSEQKPGTDGQQ